jgi:hypothetical protein
MTANIVRVEAAAILNATFAEAAYTDPTTPIKVAMDSAVGSDTAAGTEISGGSYARQTLTMAAASTGSYPTSIASNVALTYTNMPAVTVTSVDIFDSAGTPIRRWFGALTSSKTTNAGDTLTIASGSLTATLG